MASRSLSLAPVAVGALAYLVLQLDYVRERLAKALIEHGLPAHAIDPFELDAGADVVVVLLPLRARTLSPVGITALSVLGRIRADPLAAADFRSRLVVAWYLRHADRLSSSAPKIPGQVRWNASELLLGSSWRRELAHHGGDERAAVNCRSTRVERLVHAAPHVRLGANRVADVVEELRTLDPTLRHCVCVEVVDHDEVVTRRWTGAASVAAAARAAREAG
ncbi:hypothetical protein ACRAKI_17520 [Saccharothrix isguenensis]